MSYSIPDIIQWSKIAQPLARYWETKRLGRGDSGADPNLDIKIYQTRKDVEYAYAQDPTSNETYSEANYLLSLIGVYLFAAQDATGGGGSISPITPGTSPDPYDFEVGATTSTNAPIKATDTSVTLSRFQGYNILFVRNNITQSTVNQGGTCYTWDKTTANFTLVNGAAQLTEIFQIYPVL